MPEIVAHIGVIGSGKDYRSSLLEQQGYVRIDFKDALLDMASDLVGYDVRADYDWFKRHLVGTRRPENKFLEVYAQSDLDAWLTKHPKAMTGRRLLQRLGTDVMRKRDADFWVKAWREKALPALDSGRSVSVADCRFANEVEAVRSTAAAYSAVIDGGLRARFVYCDFRSKRYDPTGRHESEALAQSLLGSGLTDGEEIPLELLAKEAAR